MLGQDLPSQVALKKIKPLKTTYWQPYMNEPFLKPVQKPDNPSQAPFDSQGIASNVRKDFKPSIAHNALCWYASKMLP